MSLDDYVRGLVARDLVESARGFREPSAHELRRPEPESDISIFFDLIDEGPPTDIARDKDKLGGGGLARVPA
jgi:hypothetical protein